MTDYSHRHNLVDPAVAGAERRFGIRYRLPSTDPFTRLVGTDWQREEWYPTRAERDEALSAKRTRHGYYREGDEVSVIYEAVDRDA